MNSKATTEILDSSVENFADSVRSEFDKLKSKATQNTESRVKKFIDSGTQRLLKSFDKSSWVTKGIVTAGSGILAYGGMNILKRAIDGLFGIGHWVAEKLGLTRKNTLKNILKITLGVGAIILIPLLYQAVKMGNIKITDIVKIWKSGGVLGVFKLLSNQFPEGISNMAKDVIDFFKKNLGEKMVKEGVEKAKKKSGELKDKSSKIIKEKKSQATQAIGKKADKVLPENLKIKKDKITQALEDKGVKASMEKLIHDNSVLVLKEGSLYVMKATGELLDLSRWLTLQWVDSMNDVKKEILKNPEHWFGALTTQYLEESVNFMILASGADFVSSLFNRGKVISPLKSVIAGTISGLKWGAYPFRIIGAAKNTYPKLAAKSPAFVRIAGGSIEFLGKGGKNLAKISAKTGKLIFWEGGKWAVAKTAEKLGAKASLQQLGKAISLKYQESIGKRLIELGNKEMMQKVLKTLGWRGAAMSGMVANDVVPFLGWLDIILEVGLGAWLSYDVYQFIKRYRNALKFNELKKIQDTLKIKSIDILDQPSQDSFDIKLKSLGKKESDLSSEDYLNILDSLPLVRFKITREDNSTEIFTIKRGNIVNVSILDKDNKKLLTLEREDIDATLKSIPAPTDIFKQWEIDYNQSTDTLKANYKEALRYIKNETGWQQIQMDIIDARTIRIYRSDTGTESYMTRDEKNSWHISEYPKTGFDFFQALSMTNLVNRVDDLVKGYWIKGSDNPFYEEDGDIYYGRIGNDVKILSGKEKSWKKFFNNMKVSDKDLIDLLNHFHQEKK